MGGGWGVDFGEAGAVVVLVGVVLNEMVERAGDAQEGRVGWDVSGETGRRVVVEMLSAPAVVAALV